MKSSTLSKNLRKIAAYAVIVSQILTSAQHLVAMELLSASVSPRKVLPEETINAANAGVLSNILMEDANPSGNKIHPAPKSEELDPEIPDIADDASIDSVDQHRASDADIKKFDTYLNNNLRNNYSAKDYAIFASVLIGTVLLGYGAKLDNKGEIFAEARMWSDNVFFTFAQIVEGYRFVYMDPSNDSFINQVMDLQKINSYIFLTPYVATRLYAMASYADSCFSTYLPTTQHNKILKGLLYTGAILGGANAGGSLASQYYSTNIAFAAESAEFAKILTPYILTFYCLDAILTYSQLIRNTVVPEMIKYSESKEDHQLRKKLSQKIESGKEV
ncbi:MAG: hypothetical protein C0432_00860 [Candidatus Puniceispirillum sp.]|nr:hypothetical protein [Candidatus Pelagibacter sp.]MBA4282832.1 hypothetical protein [Candidatus Puniceispirillum sp.]